MSESKQVTDVEQARRFAVAAKSLLSRRYREMQEARLNSAGSFDTYMKAVDAYQRQEELFQAAVEEWKQLHEKEEPQP